MHDSIHMDTDYGAGHSCAADLGEMVTLVRILRTRNLLSQTLIRSEANGCVRFPKRDDVQDEKRHGFAPWTRGAESKLRAKPRREPLRLASAFSPLLMAVSALLHQLG